MKKGPVSAFIEHHYRREWSWDDDLMPRAAARLDAWLGANDGGAAADGADPVLAEVRAALDRDLDTPSALAAIDAAAASGRAIGPAAALLGVELSR